MKEPSDPLPAPTASGSHPPAHWHFVDDRGTFRLEGADRTRYLYFPLVGEGTPFASVTPGMAGDHTAGHDRFLLPPTSVEALHEDRYRRAVWLRIDGHEPWAADGGSAPQRAARFSGAESATVTAGPLWHRVARTHAASGVETELTSFVPPEGGVEALHVSARNGGTAPVEFDVTVAIPVYGRSAEALRDHRHVTSLLNRAEHVEHGVVVRPTMIFDERGHRRGDMASFVYGRDAEGRAPVLVRSSLNAFTGERGDLDWPAAIVAPAEAGTSEPVPGDEVIAALTFARVTLAPSEGRTWTVAMGLAVGSDDAPDAAATLARVDPKSGALERTAAAWAERLDALQFHFGDAERDGWHRWIGIQPILRRLYGNSFLPYHDYGRGGRGWRDLWQDSLALLLMDAEGVAESLHAHFAGVRLDGTNATIIGSRPGEFKADRNAIARTWMDHGAWPLLTVKLHLDRSGDWGFLLREQTYFRDRLTMRARVADPDWTEAAGTLQRDRGGTAWNGTILEHLLVQHLTTAFNAGDHGCLRLEDADWNDGMDLGREQGESVAFTALYAGNLADLADLAEWLRDEGHATLRLANELGILLDGARETTVEGRRAVLARYLDAQRKGPSGASDVPVERLTAALRSISGHLAGLVREQEWVEEGWFNGYYDNHGRRVEGRFDGDRVRMTLTGQVFPLMAGIATPVQAQAVARAAREHLWSDACGGYRLNTDFEEVRMDLGRAFGFAYGHKENGAMFTHMAVMFAFGLSRYGLAREAWDLLDRLYLHLRDFEKSRMYPGLPEYTDPQGRGRYPWLTGSAAWYLHVMLSAMFGVRGRRGDLHVAPSLPAAAFTHGEVAVTTGFAGRRVRVIVRNPSGVEPGAFRIARARLAGHDVTPTGASVTIGRASLVALDAGATHELVIELGPAA